MGDRVVYNQLEALFEVLIRRLGDCNEELGIVEEDAWNVLMCAYQTRGGGSRYLLACRMRHAL